MNLDGLKQLISQGESETLEIKTSAPSPDVIARYLSAFSNGDGGYLVLGVREPNQITGVNPARARAAIERARQSLSGDVQITVETVDAGGTPVAVAKVDRAPKLVAARGAFYRRCGVTTRPIQPEEIREHLTRSAAASIPDTPAQAQQDDSTLVELSRAVASQSATIDQIRKDFNKVNSPVRKALLAGGGAVAGFVGKELVEPLLPLILNLLP